MTERFPFAGYFIVCVAAIIILAACSYLIGD